MQFSTRHNETQVGNYTFSKTIGEGTFGKVKMGIHKPTGEKVAIKMLEKEKIVEHADMERISREICILEQLRHPHIIQLYEIIETKRYIYLIMEYAEGGELFDYIVKKKRVDETEAVRFMQQILSGADYLHNNLIAHRDLKPENLLLDSKKNIKIVDFGLSNQYKSGEKLSTACGSPCYAAPEMIAGKTYSGPNADIWSCGVIMYALLCGYLPFEDPNTNKLYKKILSGQYEVPKGLSREAQELLRLVLNTNPEERYTIEEIRRSRWLNLATDSASHHKGITVGKDKMEVNYEVISQLEQYNIDGHQAVAYLETNRHNSVTATYYILLRKFQRQSDHGLIHRVPRQDNHSKLYDFMAKRREKTDANEVNSSLTFEQIKSALIQKKQYTPTTKLDFDPKVKHSYNKEQLVASLNPDRLITTSKNEGKVMTESTWVSGTKRGKVESVMEVFSKKHKKDDAQDILNKYQTLTTRYPAKKVEFTKSFVEDTETLKPSPPKPNSTIQQPLTYHSGPFNTRCLFKESAANLFRRILKFLTVNSIGYKIHSQLTQSYTICVEGDLKVWIEGLECSPGLNLVVFGDKSPLNEKILNHLQRKST